MKAIYKALAEFQQEVPVLHQPNKSYGYTYTDLTAILEVVNPLLKKHGLGFTQPLNGQSIKTILFHLESGESIESTIEIPQGVILKGMNSFQVLGSAITYLRRYSLSSMLGLVTDKDADAHGEQATIKQPLTPEQFKKTLASTPEQIKTVIAKFDLDDNQKKQLNAKL